MTPKVTINEIAMKAGLSIATVSRAMNPDTRHLVNKSTLRRVNAIIEKERYFPSLPAKRLASGKSNNIVIFYKPDFKSAFYNDYYSKMFAGAMKAVENTPYNLLISLIKEGRGGFDIEPEIRKMDIAAAILCNFMGVFKVSAKNIFNLDIPIFIINQYLKEKNERCFLIDNFASAYDATAYLIAKGHKKIAFIRGTKTVKDAQDRFSGYRKALADNSLPFEKDISFNGNFEEDSGRAAARQFFKRKNRLPTAVLCSNDLMAIGLINELAVMNLECPRDVSVVGFDGIDTGRYTNPPLTTVRQPIYEMALDAVREAINIVEKKCVFKGTKYFRAKIIERGSVLPRSQ